MASGTPEKIKNEKYTFKGDVAKRSHGKLTRNARSIANAVWEKEQ